MLMNTSPVIAEQHGALRLLTLNRADKLNAFTPEMLAALEAGLDDALADDATRVIAITGSGPKAFAAGNDIERLVTLDSAGAYRDMVAGQRALLRLHESAKPTIAMVNGFALGGGFELALACDFVIASTKASFGFPEITLNTMPGWGGTQLAVAKMGLACAKRFVLSGRRHTAQECASFGFLHEIVEHDALFDTVREFAETLAVYDPFAMEMAKRALNRANEMPLSAGLDFEAAQYAVNFTSEGARAGLRQFMEKRLARRASTVTVTE
ncbi:enoyl-CoA hydratase/isomerase family protein [Caballeronia sp. LP006]|jgi:enoyl-CoA hydratase/3-hydroxypropionyl-coenzyme A dehydratase|uniref:enoyl-CoA hydratase/isomerase family protein n=2 Tax=Caballeronia TaxID=1827195 RepID=UPI001FD39AB2|nr:MULTISPECIES: enoyl-CoA hydratase/isomerase family protein [unclassified Caballeronia]MDR5774421.1 enoyl-CoA hydratase/isomerase family protein [Caballeronia sp. LZ002]MDR5826405.1 enoyl-CoA hydratase/isomerase family protein [Caballeronia sp. LP006]MDR5849856.1 enoyl-CoA hydratase/isomerase family protein [Caballeronia sp. LZ003]